MKRGPVVRGIDNGNLLVKREILDKNFDVQLSGRLNAPSNSEDIWNDSGCSYTVGMRRSRVQYVVETSVVVPINTSQNLVLDIELIDFRGAYMSAPDFAVIRHGPLETAG